MGIAFAASVGWNPVAARFATENSRKGNIMIPRSDDAERARFLRLVSGGVRPAGRLTTVEPPVGLGTAIPPARVPQSWPVDAIRAAIARRGPPVIIIKHGCTNLRP